MSAHARSSPTPHADAGLRERARGAYFGLAVGDALGAPVEFKTASEIRREFGVHHRMTGGGWLRLRPGQITDDTEMSLALGQAIVDAGGWNLQRIAEAFAAWLRGKPIDVGNTCRRGIQRFVRDGSLAAPSSEDAGNGACMRNLPAVLFALHDAALLERCTLEQSHITHHNALSDAGTLTVAHMLRLLLLGAPFDAVRFEAERLVQHQPQFRFAPYPGRAGGYIVDTLQTVLHHFLTTGDFEACLVAVVNRGEDADTTGAIVGALAGARYGYGAIPHEWLRKLDRGVVARIEAQVEALLALAWRHAPAGAHQ